MEEAGLSGPTLAAATKAVDPEGKGISPAMVGFITGTGKSARDECSERAADLIAMALNKPTSRFFETTDVAADLESTSTPREQTQMRPTEQQIEGLVDLTTLTKLIGKSKSWIYEQRIAHPRGSEHPFPIRYAGQSPRFLFSEVLAWMDAVFSAAIAA
jgi:predicted DNA-binding transcriptional regulator AlpA